MFLFLRVMNMREKNFGDFSVTPAKAGVHCACRIIEWIPAFAGVMAGERPGNTGHDNAPAEKPGETASHDDTIVPFTPETRTRIEQKQAKRAKVSVINSLYELIESARNNGASDEDIALALQELGLPVVMPDDQERLRHRINRTIYGGTGLLAALISTFLAYVPKPIDDTGLGGIVGIAVIAALWGHLVIDLQSAREKLTAAPPQKPGKKDQTPKPAPVAQNLAGNPGELIKAVRSGGYPESSEYGSREDRFSRLKGALGWDPGQDARIVRISDTLTAVRVVSGEKTGHTVFIAKVTSDLFSVCTLSMDGKVHRPAKELHSLLDVFFTEPASEKPDPDGLAGILMSALGFSQVCRIEPMEENTWKLLDPDTGRQAVLTREERVFQAYKTQRSLIPTDAHSENRSPKIREDDLGTTSQISLQLTGRDGSHLASLQYIFGDNIPGRRGNMPEALAMVLAHTIEIWEKHPPGKYPDQRQDSQPCPIKKTAPGGAVFPVFLNRIVVTSRSVHPHQRPGRTGFPGPAGLLHPGPHCAGIPAGRCVSVVPELRRQDRDHSRHSSGRAGPP